MRMSGTLEIQKKKQQTQHDIFFNKKIVAPEKLKILVLSGNQITSQQLEFIHKCTNLLKLDLSNNNISKISPKLNLEKLNKLEILYLHQNKIQNTPALEGVFSLPKLTHLTIRENPVKKLPRIQHIVVNLLPTLKALDDRVIFIEERSATLIWERESVYIEPQICEGWKTKDNTEAHYIKILELQLKYFNNVWVKNNPIIMIQRAWRQIVRNKRSKRIKERNNRDQIINNLQTLQIIRQNSSQGLMWVKKFFGEWKIFSKNRKSVKQQLQSTSTYPENKIYLTYPLKKFKLAQRNIRVEKIIKKYVSYIKNKIFLRKMANKIYRHLKIKRTQFNSQESFFSLCQISKTNRFYFNKIQTHLLQNFLIHLSENFNYEDHIKQSTSTGAVTHYLSIRTVDPETYTVKKVYSVLTYSMWPSTRVVFLKKKKFQSKHKTGMIKIKPLYYIKNRNKVLPPQDFKKSCRIYKQLQNFHRKEYENTLDYFECRNEEIMKMLLRYIYYHNAKVMKFEKKTKKNQMQSLLQNYEEPFMIYVQNILQRTAAAVRIQQNWRKYLTNKRSEESIYVKMKKTRAALRIQRFWRDRIFYHRLSYQRNIAYHIKLFNLNTFMIPCQIYMRFEEICRKKQKKQLYKGLKIVKSGQNLKAIWDMQKPIYSPNIANHFKKQASLAEKSTEVSEQCDVWNILHFKSKVSKIQYGQKMYYELKFDSVEEAKYRLYLISIFSYKCRYSTFFLPISRDTLDLIHLRFKQYQKVELVPSELTIPEKRNKSKNSLKIKEEESVRIDKIGILKYYNQEGVFLSDKTHTFPKKSVYNFNSQFYQKIYQDHPRKETSQIYYYIDDQIKEQKQLEKQRAIQQLIKDIKIEPESQQIKYSHINSEWSEKGEDTFMNITKIDKKRLSFYDVGVRTQVLKKQAKQKPKTRGEFFYDNVDRRQNISRVKMQSTVRKQQIVQKKTENLKKMRDNISKQRQSNLNVKNRNQIERNQQMKRKVERIRQMKSRISNSKKQDHQQDFIQQGNFVMQQQLKMVIMRSKMESMQPRKRQSNKSETSSQKHSQSFSKSFYTQQKNKEIKVFQNGGNVAKQIAQSLGATLVTNNPIDTSNVIEGQERKIINIRNQRRSKSRSIGAYLRDPSLVHGVFPEQYYPIDNKQGGTFKFLPPLI